MSDDTLPPGLVIEMLVKRYSLEGKGVYVLNKGPYAGGMILMKLLGAGQKCKLLTQQRNLDGDLEWISLFDELIEEGEADGYISRSITRDPDIWAIEIEDTDFINPLD